MTDAIVRINTGTSGYVIRLPQAAVFVSGTVAQEIEAAVRDSNVLDTIGAWLVERQFESPPLVAVEWADRPRILAFGDIEVISDHPAIPMLTAAGSGTWVERSVAPDRAFAVTIGGDADELTHIESGLVPAAGIQIELSPSTIAKEPALAPQAVAGAPTNAHAQDGVPNAEDRTPQTELDASGRQAAHAGGPPYAPRPEPHAGQESPAEPDEPGDPVVSMGVDETPPVAGSEAGADDVVPAPGASVGGDEEPAITDESTADAEKPDSAATPFLAPPPAEADPAPGDIADTKDPSHPDLTKPLSAALTPALDSETLEAPAEPAPPLAPPSSPPPGDRPGPKVRARLCASGHANPPELLDCEVCGSPIDPNGPETEADRPSLGTFVFDTGTRIALTTDLVLGRSPDEVEPHPAAITLPLDDETGLMSRAHLEVRLRRWIVEICDLDTSNGTSVFTGSEPIKLKPGEYMRIEPGHAVAMGGRSFEFEGRTE